MANNNEKRIFVQIETTKEEKEALKQFTDDKNTTMSNFVRTCIRFFMDRNMTPEEYLMKEIDNKAISKEDIPASFIKHLEERDLEFKNHFESIKNDINNMETKITSELLDYMQLVAQEFEQVKRK
jgi:hypothetical protein